MRGIKRRLIACLMTISLGASVINTISIDANAESETKDIVVVSMGDSYSSGEGLGEYYGWDDDVNKRVLSKDFLAHRSRKAWGGQISFDGGKTVLANNKYDKDSNKDGNWYFVATSGAETKHLKNEQKKEFTVNGEKQSDTLDRQLDVFDEIERNGKKADYVTLTIGGNDLDFEGIVRDVAFGNNMIMYGMFEVRMDLAYFKISKIGKTRQDLKEAYTNICECAGPQAKLIVAGYPKLFDGTVYLGSYRNQEMAEVNSAVSDFNKVISDITSELDNVYFVSVEGKDGFDGHGVLSSKPYINKIEIVNRFDIDYKNFVSSMSIHPNELGAKVYRNRVQKKILELEKEREAVRKKNAKLLNELLQDYKQMISDGDSEPFASKYSLKDYHQYETVLQYSDYYYSYYDINRDGFDELVISQRYDDYGPGAMYDLSANPFEVYAVIDGKIEPIYLGGDAMFGTCTFTKDGNMFSMSPVTDAIYNLYLYKYDFEWNKEEIKSLEVNMADETSWYYEYTEKGQTKKLSLDEGYKYYEDFVEAEEVELDMTLLSKGAEKPKEPETTEATETQSNIREIKGFKFVIPEGFSLESENDVNGGVQYTYTNSVGMQITIFVAENYSDPDDYIKATGGDVPKEIVLDMLQQDGYVVSGYLYDTKDTVFYEKVKYRRNCYTKVYIQYKNDANKGSCDSIVEGFIGNIDYGPSGD